MQEIEKNKEVKEVKGSKEAEAEKRKPNIAEQEANPMIFAQSSTNHLIG